VIELYDYQRAAVEQLRRVYAAGRRAPLLVLPTGGGKTVCFTYLASRAADKGLRVLVLVHRRELVQQVSAALTQWDVPHGCIAPAAAPTDAAVQVAMVQTLARRVKLDRVGAYRFDLVIVDEAHHCIEASSWGAVLKHNSGARILGVTATPCRLDGKGLGAHCGGFFDAMVTGPSVSELVEIGRLARPVVFAPEHAVDLSGVRKRGGDYVSGELAARMDSLALTGDAVAHYRRHCNGAPAIAFAVTTEHAAHIAEDFARQGFQAAVLTGATPDKERARMIDDLGHGALQVLASCNVVSEGTDVPAVTAAILLRPTASYALAMQQIGRALRSVPGKERALILDHAGNCHRHGLPTEPVEWTLEGAKRGGVAPMKGCFRCEALVPASASVCPECGHVFGGSAGQEVELPLPLTRAGELVELTPEKRAEMRRARIAEERRARTAEDLATLGRARGYQYPDSWAKHRWHELHGRRRA
jgi:superfamily II DNA or RNA helicase